MATVKCPLGKRGSPSHEWHDGEKSRIYCQGWEDKRTDEPLEACRNCPDHVSKAQDDLEKWRADHPLVSGFDTSDFPDMTVVATFGRCDVCDRVEVVRCKDCKHYMLWEDSEDKRTCSKSIGLMVSDPDDFCSYGERRE